LPKEKGKEADIGADFPAANRCGMRKRKKEAAAKAENQDSMEVLLWALPSWSSDISKVLGSKVHKTSLKASDGHT
jgi:hypothetical protein